MRTILHSDCNNFYASVEIAYDPSLRGLPLAVCGDPQLRHGIILAKSPAAKACGVSTGEAIWQAQLKCPTLRLIPADQRKYLAFSRKMRVIYRRYTPFVEPFGLDESWLDVTGHALSGERIAAQIRTAAKEELGITVSIGVSFNKVFAKLGSDLHKPDCTTVISRENYRAKVWPLPVDKLLFVGRATQKRLQDMGVLSIGDLACCNPEALHRVLGKNGDTLRAYARGEDLSPVLSADTAETLKSVGNSTTPPKDIENFEEAKAILYLLSDSVGARLRKHRLRCHTVSIWFRNTGLESFTRQTALEEDSNLGQDIAKAALALCARHYNWDQPLRSIGVCGMDLSSETLPCQIDLIKDESHLKNRALESALDSIRGRWGHQSISRAVLLRDRKMTGINPVDDFDLQPLGAMRGRG